MTLSEWPEAPLKHSFYAPFGLQGYTPLVVASRHWNYFLPEDMSDFGPLCLLEAVQDISIQTSFWLVRVNVRKRTIMCILLCIPRGDGMEKVICIKGGRNGARLTESQCGITVWKEI